MAELPEHIGIDIRQQSAALETKSPTKRFFALDIHDPDARIVCYEPHDGVAVAVHQHRVAEDGVLLQGHGGRVGPGIGVPSGHDPHPVSWGVVQEVSDVKKLHLLETSVLNSGFRGKRLGDSGFKGEKDRVFA